MSESIDDVVAVQQLVLRERQGRDRGWWDQMAATFHPESRVRVTWFEGTGPEFVAESEKMVAPGRRMPVHHMATPVIHVRGDRALAEVAGSIHLRMRLHGVPADLTSLVRLLYRAERGPSGWRLRSLDCIYESDSIVPVPPAEPIDFDRDLLAGFRESYRFLAYHLARSRGRVPPDDLYGDDRPDDLRMLYAEAFEWLGDLQ